MPTLQSPYRTATDYDEQRKSNRRQARQPDSNAESRRLVGKLDAMNSARQPHSPKYSIGAQKIRRPSVDRNAPSIGIGVAEDAVATIETAPLDSFVITAPA